METNEKNNGRGVFYAIMGVATLVFTIVGATFAYFAATTNSAANAINTTGGSVTLGFDDVTTGRKTALIPVDSDLAQFPKGGYTKDGVSYKYVGIGANDCRDANGNNICSVYQFTVTNSSANSSQRVYPTFKVNANTFTNLKYAVFKGTAEQVANSTNGWKVNGTAVTAETTSFNETGSFANTKTTADATRKHVIGNPGDLIVAAKTPVDETWSNAGTTDWDRLVQILDVGESMTYTIVLWIEETGANQNVDMNKNFGATVSFTTEGNNTGVTGSLLA